MKRAIIVALREVKSYLTDKGDLAFSLLLPVIVFALMYGAFGGETLFHGTAYVVNEDASGVYSQLLLKRLVELQDVDIALITRDEAEFKLSRSDVQLVVNIPADFSRNLDAGWPAQLIFRQRGNGGQEGQVVASLVRSVAGQMDQELQVKRQVRSALGGTKEHIDVTVQKYLDREHDYPFVTVEEDTVGSRPDPVSQFLPGVITMFTLFAITLNSRSLIEERQKGLLERLVTTRLKTGELFAGKFLASTLRGFIQTFILLALAYAVFRIFTPLSFLTALAVALVFAMAGSGVGMVIASISKSEEQASWIVSLFTMSSTMLGGTFFNISEGSFLYTLSQLSMNTYANDAFKVVIARGGSLAAVWYDFVVMAGVTLAGLIVSRLFFKVMAGGK
jgi:ABC-2 type transport system permease protein